MQTPSPQSDFGVKRGDDPEFPAQPLPLPTPPEVSPIKKMAYGGWTGKDLTEVQSAQIYRLERGFPAFRRGKLLAAMPRTKAETLYANDPGQAIFNPILNTGATGAAQSGTAQPGTSNAPNTTTGAIMRYRTTYKTNVQ